MNDEEKTLQLALQKKSMGYGLKNSEITALSHFERVPRRPVSGNYRALGAITNQVVDRIHTTQDPYGSGGGSGGVPVGVVRGSDGKIINVVSAPGGGTLYPTILKVLSGSFSATLDATTIAHNMSFKEFDFCDGGVAKKILLLASDPY